MTGRRTIAVIATGGTIASQPREQGGVVAQLDGSQLVAGLGDALDGIAVHVAEHSRKNAFLFTPHELMGIAATARAHATSDGIDGVVVTHGTDTMEETAFLTDLLYAGAAPIVFTGAQRHAGMPSPDGPRNLTDAIRIAADPATRDLGVLVALEGRIDAARDVTKLHTWALRAFGTHGAGSVGAMGPMGVRIHQRASRVAPFSQLESIEPAVHLVKLVAGMDATLLDAARMVGARGIVIEAFGLGNVNHLILAAIDRAVAANIVVGGRLAMSARRRAPRVRGRRRARRRGERSNFRWRAQRPEGAHPADGGTGAGAGAGSGSGLAAADAGERDCFNQSMVRSRSARWLRRKSSSPMA
jgi:L-asparaginase